MRMPGRAAPRRGDGAAAPAPGKTARSSARPRRPEFAGRPQTYPMSPAPTAKRPVTDASGLVRPDRLDIDALRSALAEVESPRLGDHAQSLRHFGHFRRLRGKETHSDKQRPGNWPARIANAKRIVEI
jgi:hypothetical protein